MSDDVNVMAMFSGSTARPIGTEGPLLPDGSFYSQPQTPDYSGLFKMAVGIGNAGRSIGEGRAVGKERSRKRLLRSKRSGSE